LLHTFRIKLHRPVPKLESFLHQSGQFADSTALLAEDFLRVARADDDFGAGGGDADFAACVALFGEFAGEEFVEFGEEDAVGDKLVPRVRIYR
jgi:pantoate kinase